MAPAIVHFLVGAAICLVAATPVALRYDLGDRWPLWLVLAGGLWGLFPDLHHVAPAYEADLLALHDSRLANLFAAHGALDAPAVRARYDESVFGGVVAFVGAVGAFTLASGLRDRLDEEAVRPPAPAVAAGAAALLGALALAAVLRSWVT